MTDNQSSEEVRARAMEIFRRTREEIDPMLLLRTKQMIEEQAEDGMFDAMGLPSSASVPQQTRAQNPSPVAEDEIPVDRTKMREIVMEYIVRNPDQTRVSGLLKKILRKEK
ncbi:MAG: hypothetical protein QF692_04025 [Alphaproteobacteria bacterium]|jgi:hypothetical protein|nr:hypothetical protein [Alphaproteobacteria bacterium]MDP7222415.1 hypothetical protein [Alphaproteobacteria bacterium]